MGSTLPPSFQTPAFKYASLLHVLMSFGLTLHVGNGLTGLLTFCPGTNPALIKDLQQTLTKVDATCSSFDIFMNSLLFGSIVQSISLLIVLNCSSTDWILNATSLASNPCKKALATIILLFVGYGFCVIFHTSFFAYLLMYPSFLLFCLSGPLPFQVSSPFAILSLLAFTPSVDLLLILLASC